MNFLIGQDFVIKQQIRPAAAISSAGASNGVTLQKATLASEVPDAVALLSLGAYTGGGTFSVTMKIQDSADGSVWDDVTDLNLVEAATVALTSQNTNAQLPFRLKHLRNYFRMVATVAFTGGTSPTILVVGDILLLNPRQSG